MRLPVRGIPPDESGLVGSWSATRWQYRSRMPPQRVVDLVCDLGGSITLSLSGGSFILVWDLGGTGRRCLAGAVTAAGDRLAFRPDAAGAEERVRYRLGPGELTLSSEESAWSMDGDDTDHPATWVAILVRV